MTENDWWLPSRLKADEASTQLLNDFSQLDTKGDFGAYRRLVLGDSLENSNASVHNDLFPRSKVHQIFRYLDLGNPKTILDLGSGMSTLVLAKSAPGAKVFSIDNSAEYAGKTKKMLSLHKVTNAEVRVAPLVAHASGVDWYDVSQLADISDIHLLFIDGPPGSKNDRARHPALTECLSKLSPRAIIVIDDASSDTFKAQYVGLSEKVKIVQLEQNVGRSRIRNTFLEHTDASYLLFIDCDSRIVKPNYLKDYLKAISTINPLVLFGASVYQKETPRIYYRLRWRYGAKIESKNYSLKQLPLINGGIVVMDPYTGRVLALSGGFSFKKSEFNRATQALRQPGSAFKPFIYALALENGYTPSTLILDAPLVLEQGTDLKMWKPENYGKKFYGPSTLRMGLEKSRNLMTVRIAQDLGVKKIVNFSKKLGIYENPSELLSISLGSEETILLKLTSAYSSFVNGGKLVKPIMIDRIQDSEGVTIFNNEMRECINCDQISHLSDNYPKIEDKFEQIFSPETAYQMTSILEGTVQNGTGKNLKDLNLDLAGKTGTTNGNTDTWFIGFTSKLVIGVYVGSDNPRSLGRYETGAKTALPIFKSFVKKAVKKEDARPFKVAKNILMKVIDPVTGEKAEIGTRRTIIEAYKEVKVENLLNKDINNRLKNNNILRFY